ncbi:receptor-like protein 34 [Capsicum galapagoense]
MNLPYSYTPMIVSPLISYVLHLLLDIYEKERKKEMERILSLVSLFLFLYAVEVVSFSSGHPLCSSHDYLALVQFKHSLNVTTAYYYDEDCESSAPKTASWNTSSMDCCTWDGVTCDSITGHVIGLDLSCSRLEGTIHPNSSLFHLRHLQTLQLFHNNLRGPIPESIRNLSQIIHLDLSDNNLESEIPDAFSNLQNLTHLRLDNNTFTGRFPSSLVNLTKLKVLRLGYNSLSGPLPFTANGLQNLEDLFLSHNLLNGSIPSWMNSLPSLFYLRLDNNLFSGSLSLGQNKLNGEKTGAQMFSKLQFLHLSFNNLSGEVGAAMFSSMKNLYSLDLSHSGLSWSINKDNTNTTFPLLYYLGLGSCRVKDFPDFLLYSEGLSFLDLSENEIQGQFPKWFGGLSGLQSLNLSHNYLTSLDHLPNRERIMVLDLQSNSLTGPLPSSLCSSNYIRILDLSYNNMSGDFSNCSSISNCALIVLDLRGNNFHGPIPNIFSQCDWLRHIGLSENQLEGPIPRSLVNCTSLQVLDLGNNKIHSTFPTWMEALQELEILILKSNRFYGPIGGGFRTKSPFPNLRIFDISGNSFSGSLPTEVLKGFTAMMNMDAHKSRLGYMEGEDDFGNYRANYRFSVTLVMKNQEIEFTRILKILTTFDLSRNKFEGEIPKFIGNLNSLRLLNLSRNNLSGHIPVEMKNMSALEALDLSFNQLTGKIPVELAILTFLAVLNLSHNHLVGPIPRSNQFNTFPNDSYFGNSELCGFPLSKECGQRKSASVPVSLFEQEEEEEPGFLSEMTWQSVLIGYSCGLTFGFGIMYLIYRIQRPRWFIDLLETINHEMIYRIQRGRKRRGNNRRRRQ